MEKTKKNQFGPKEYKIAETTVSTVEEAISAYGISTNRLMQIIGLEGQTEYQGLRNDNELINIIRRGIPKMAMASLLDVGNLTLADMAVITHTSDRTLRRYKPQEKLTQDQTERMIELAKLYTRGEEVFGTMELFNEWMNSRLLPFNNKRPKDYLDTLVGINMISDELGRIEHGVLA